jgi:hypothetical protein
LKIVLLRRSIAPVLAALAVSLGGCGPMFDPPHELTSLRVLGVKKDKPYAAPGETVELSMLWHDVKGRSTIQVLWLSGCTNPPGDLYAGCFEQLGGGGGSGPEGEAPGVKIGDQSTFSFQIPVDILSSRPPPPDERQPKYGLSYVFFAVCAGTLALAPSGGGATFPLRCLDEKDEPLGSEDFVAGYTAVYTFEGFGNRNPAFLDADNGGGFEFRGNLLAPDCVGETCLAEGPRTIDCSRTEDQARCVPACKDDGEPTCEGYPLRAVADPDSAEPDAVSAAIYGRQVEEQMWINYYVDGGGLRSGVKLLNDATAGWNDAHGTDFFAPKTPGRVQVWAVAHDNRGGSEFMRFSLQVE